MLLPGLDGWGTCTPGSVRSACRLLHTIVGPSGLRLVSTPPKPTAEEQCSGKVTGIGTRDANYTRLSSSSEGEGEGGGYEGGYDGEALLKFPILRRVL